MLPFDERRALIYGAARGIGRAVALEFARRGADVAIADIDSAGAAQTAADIAKLGRRAFSVACDVTDSASVRAAADATEQQLGDVDIVMNNVGVILSGNPEDIPLAEWKRVIDLNLFSVIHGVDVFLPRMLARGSGYIVNTASFAGLYPYATNRMPYVASKAAVIALSESLALYLSPKGIRVSCLCPGPVMTNVMDGMKSWSANASMAGPGAQYELRTAEQAATILADGMRDGRVLIPTDEKVWEVMRKHVESPDAFIEVKAAEFARGEWGRPTIPSISTPVR